MCFNGCGAINSSLFMRYPQKYYIMNTKTLFNFLLGFLLVLIGCKKQKVIAENENNKTELIKEVRNQVDAFLVADTTLNSEAVVDLLWPEFTMLADGNYLAYKDVKAGSKAFMATLEVFHTEWDDVQIILLGESHAISSFIFTDSLVAKDGTITQSRGPNTFVWEKRNGIWKVRYADADHYPIE